MLFTPRTVLQELLPAILPAWLQILMAVWSFCNLFSLFCSLYSSAFIFIFSFIFYTFYLSPRGAAFSGLIHSARHFSPPFFFFVNGRQYVITWAELSVAFSISSTHAHRYRLRLWIRTHDCALSHSCTHTHKYMPPQLEVHSCCCLPCRDQKNILYSSPGENLPSHNKHKPSTQFEAPLWVVSVAIEAKVPSSSPAW